MIQSESLNTVSRKEGFTGIKTNKYRMNYYETPTGLKFVLNTDLSLVGTSQRDVLHQLYEQIIIPYVVRNPIGSLNEPIKCATFESKLDEFFKKSTIF